MVDEMLDNQDEIQSEDEVSDTDVVVDEQDTPIQSSSFIGSFIQLLLALAFIIALIVLISKWVKKKNGFLGKQQILENYGGITVGPNKTIQTIKIGERFFVVGVADNIDLLMEITDADTIEKLKNQEEERDALDKLTSKWKKEPKEIKTNDTSQFMSLFNKELSAMKEGRKKVYQKLKESSKDNDDISH
ncbi:flagellar biosynthetic protein FliO [Gracilibacillus pellucidus]|uniref:flagellar biosynthetic protein FliO n=1 Tax=Gracilibacillus pellucidus TaxID=3095368 RepID=UPI0029F53A53|nr:flagellar biosynthetic protein FliO [Gracilibacillus sp. S3-1-1]